MNKLTIIGRFLYALPFAVFGINHFIMMDYYMGLLTSFIPHTAFVLLLTGILLIAASISILTGKLIRLSTILLAALLFIFIITIHIPHLVHGIDKTETLINLLKDTSLMGGSLMIAGIYSNPAKLAKKD
jgi:putative oxidoreductase